MGIERHPSEGARGQGLVLGSIVFAVGLATRTRDVGGDDTVFAMAVEAWLQGRGNPGDLFDTYHAAYNPIVALATWLVRLVLPHALVLDVGAGVSSFFWGVTAGGLLWVLRRHRVAPIPALLAAAAVAASGGMWSIATRMEVYTLAAAAVVAWLAACAAERPRPLVVGAALAGALLAHVALVVLVLPTAWRLRRQPRGLLWAAALGLGVPAILTLAVFTLGRGEWTPAGWLELIVPQESLAYVEPGSPWLAPRALRALVLWNWYRSVPVLLPAAARVMDVAGAIALSLVGVLALAGAFRALRGTEGLGRTALLALVGFTPLWLVWDVGNPEHAVAAAPLFGVLLALGATGLPRRAGSFGLAAVLALLLAVNGIAGAALQRQPEHGRLWVTAGFVQEHVGPRAVILAVGADPRMRLGLGYLSGRHVADLTLAVRSARLAGRPPTDGLAWWLERGRRSEEVWALDEVLDPGSEAWVEGLDIPLATWRAALAGLVSDHAAELDADGAVVREPFRIHRLHPS